MARGFFYIPLSTSRGCVQNALQKVSFGKHCVNLMLPCPRLLAPVHARHSRGDGQRAQRPRLAVAQSPPRPSPPMSHPGRRSSTTGRATPSTWRRLNGSEFRASQHNQVTQGYSPTPHPYQNYVSIQPEPPQPGQIPVPPQRLHRFHCSDPCFQNEGYVHVNHTGK